MIEFIGEKGGRLTYIEDILNLQNLALSFNTIFAECGNFIVSGCNISDNVISEGFVFINGKMRYFSGGNLTNGTGYIYEYNTVQQVQYSDGFAKNGRNIYSCQISQIIPTALDNITRKQPQYITIANSKGITLKDAFFGKYGVLINPDSISQTINKDIEFTGKVTCKKEIELNQNDTIFNIGYNGNNVSLGFKNEPSSKVVFSLDNNIYFYIKGTLYATINDNGVTFKKIKSEKAQLGNIYFENNSIYSSEGNVEINKSSSSDAYMDLTVYDGKGLKCLYVSGKNNSVFSYSKFISSNALSSALILQDSEYSKSSDALCKMIEWQDKNSDKIGFIGFNNTQNKNFTIASIIGDIIISPSEAAYINGKIYEDGISLEEKYVLQKNLQDALDKKSDSEQVYTKKQIEEGYQQKTKDTGWINMLNATGDSILSNLWVRQIGNIVCIQGIISSKTRSGEIVARIPIGITPPTFPGRVGFADYDKDTQYNRGCNFFLSSNSRNITVKESGYALDNIDFNITYMI